MFVFCGVLINIGFLKNLFVDGANKFTTPPLCALDITGLLYYYTKSCLLRSWCLYMNVQKKRTYVGAAEARMVKAGV